MTWIELLLTARGDQILRFKGLMNVAGNEKPVVIQGVQHVVYPPETLASWPTADRSTCLTFITQDLSRTAVENSMRSIFGANQVLAEGAA
jgi:G3E family GTPase